MPTVATSFTRTVCPERCSEASRIVARRARALALARIRELPRGDVSELLGGVAR
jgi:hypothetical protein